MKGVSKEETATASSFSTSVASPSIVGFLGLVLLKVIFLFLALLKVRPF